MCACELEIITESGGETARFRTEGVFESADGGERVRYPIEGDEGELFFSEDFFENRRRGTCALSARFSEGEESEITVGSASHTGRIPVKTTHYLLHKGGTERRIRLCYDLLGENVQSFSLKIKIVFFSEEK